MAPFVPSLRVQRLEELQRQQSIDLQQMLLRSRAKSCPNSPRRVAPKAPTAATPTAATPVATPRRQQSPGRRTAPSPWTPLTTPRCKIAILLEFEANYCKCKYQIIANYSSSFGILQHCDFVPCLEIDKMHQNARMNWNKLFLNVDCGWWYPLELSLGGGFASEARILLRQNKRPDVVFFRLSTNHLQHATSYIVDVG